MAREKALSPARWVLRFGLFFVAFVFISAGVTAFVYAPELENFKLDINNIPPFLRIVQFIQVIGMTLIFFYHRSMLSNIPMPEQKIDTDTPDNSNNNDTTFFR